MYCVFCFHCHVQVLPMYTEPKIYVTQPLASPAGIYSSGKPWQLGTLALLWCTIVSYASSVKTRLQQLLRGEATVLGVWRLLTISRGPRECASVLCVLCLPGV